MGACKDVTVNRCIHTKEEECKDVTVNRCVQTKEKECKDVTVNRCTIIKERECTDTIKHPYNPKKPEKVFKDDKFDILKGNFGKKFAKLGENIELAGGKILSKDKYKRDLHKLLKDKAIHKVDKLADKVHFKDVKKKYVKKEESQPHVVTPC